LSSARANLLEGSCSRASKLSYTVTDASTTCSKMTSPSKCQPLAKKQSMNYWTVWILWLCIINI